MISHEGTANIILFKRMSRVSKWWLCLTAVEGRDYIGAPVERAPVSGPFLCKTMTMCNAYTKNHK